MNDKDEKSNPISTGMIVLALGVYAAGQWMTISAIDSKLTALEQRITNDTSAVGEKVGMVEKAVVTATKIVKAVTPGAAEKPAESPPAASANEAPPEPAATKPEPAKPE